MKKIIALFAIVSVFGFVACNNAAETTEEGMDEATEAVEEAATEEVENAESLLEPAGDSTAAAVEATTEEAAH